MRNATTAAALIEILVTNYMATHEPLSVGEMCRVTGFSRRTLTYAFQKRYGAPPKRFFRTLALDNVRRELIRSHGSARISDVAPLYGFSNMSRFAAEYRIQFGELPSETLWKARANRHLRPKRDLAFSQPAVSA
jgi:AraC family transcriptional regulator, ethanolamine operon transcriptional activator